MTWPLEFLKIILFQDYQACLDLPAILFYKELLRVFPHSKVILTLRDPKSWYMSWHNSIAKTLELIESAPYKWFLDLDKKVTYDALRFVKLISEGSKVYMYI